MESILHLGSRCYVAGRIIDILDDYVFLLYADNRYFYTSLVKPDYRLKMLDEAQLCFR